jgi:hypothetical protein
VLTFILFISNDRHAYSIPLWEKVQRGILTDEVKQELRRLDPNTLNQPVFIAVCANYSFKDILKETRFLFIIGC